MTIVQDGDGEGAATFDPQNRAQARLAIEKAGIRHRKKLSPEAKAKLLKAGQTTRFRRMNTVLGGHLEPQERPRVSGQGSGRR